jgi:ApaG protein
MLKFFAISYGPFATMPNADLDRLDGPVYAEETEDIHVTAQPVYLESESTPSENRFVWAYHIVIENRGQQTVQLLRRYWHITDMLGRVQEVHGVGVIGEQPILEPGERFEYTSGVPLTAPSGVMRGHYLMLTDTGQSLKITIPAFSLDCPLTPRRYH